MAQRTADGTWRARARLDGRRVSRNFPTKAQAELFEAEHRIERHGRPKAAAAAPPPPVATTFRDFAERWLREYAAVEISETTGKMDEGVVRLHLIPALGHLRLSELQKSNLLRLRIDLKTKVSKKTGKPLSVKTINNVIALGKKILATAVDWDVIPASPFATVKPLRVAKQAMAYWTAEERDRFLAFCRSSDPEFAELVTVAVHTGMRRGELEALERHQLDFERRLVRIDATWSLILKKRLPRSKNRDVGFVPMNEVVYHALKDRQLMAMEARVFAKEIFSNVHRRLERRCRKASVRVIRFHDLRHSYASTLVTAGVPLYTVQRLMRHKSIAMTERYAHLAPDYLRDAAEATWARFGPDQGTPPTTVSKFKG